MARPVTIQDDTLLAAAREVFLERGVRATTAEIAARAQVSTGILFKRYKTKKALFRAAMSAQGDDAEALLPVALEPGARGVEETLTDLGTALLGQYLTFIPASMMAWSSREKGASQHERSASRTRQIAAYLAAEAKRGRVREGAAYEVVAQNLVGALWYYAFMQVTGGGKALPALAARRAHVRRVVQSLWTGLSPA